MNVVYKIILGMMLFAIAGIVLLSFQAVAS